MRNVEVSGLLLVYVADFLGSKTMCVRIGRAVSDPRPVCVGVPQGSMLSPFFFNVALADNELN